MTTTIVLVVLCVLVVGHFLLTSWIMGEMLKLISAEAEIITHFVNKSTEYAKILPEAIAEVHVSRVQTTAILQGLKYLGVPFTVRDNEIVIEKPNTSGVIIVNDTDTYRN